LLFVVVLLPAIVFGHAIMTIPGPYSTGCSSSNLGVCPDDTVPCGGKSRPSTGAVSLSTTATTIDVSISIILAHANAGNTLVLKYHTSAADTTGTVCDGTGCDLTGKTDDSTVTCTCVYPLTTVFTSTGFVSATFDATAGGGSIYRSCGAVTTSVLNTQTSCTSPTASSLSFCTWYKDSTCCTGTSTGNTFNEAVANTQYTGFTAICAFPFIGGCSDDCKNTLKLLACQSCAPAKNTAPICKELCESIRAKCSGSLLSSLLASISSGDCATLEPASSGNCWNSAANVAVSVVALVALSAVALLF